MCEFCTRHGEGKKWYENMANYTSEMFHQVNSEQRLKKYLLDFRRLLREGPARALRWKRRLPRIYNYFIAPLLSRQCQKTHFGQIVPREDAENILDRVGSIVRLPCICRKVTTGTEKRYCFAVGLDMTTVMKDVPDFSDFDRVSVDEAKKAVRELDEQGNTHSVWTFQTPFIGALCNCDRDCVAYRVQERMALGRVMWKAEYVARIDPLLCNGCKECLHRCYFKAIAYDRVNKKCSIRPLRCYGCGLCRNHCPAGAVALLDRAGVDEVAKVW